MDGVRVCPRCGSTVAASRFCSSCGVAFDAAPETRLPRAFESPAWAPAISPPTVEAPPVRPTPDPFAAAAMRRSDEEPLRELAPDSVARGLLELFAPRADSPLRRRRQQLTTELLALARSGQMLEAATEPGDVAAAFLRRYDGRPATQEAYARDLADWFVWLDGARVEPFAASLATIEMYAREPLATGRPPAPATVARRLACLSHFYRRAAYAGLVERNPVEAAQRPRVPERVATLGVSPERGRELIQAARRRGPREALLVLMLLELGLRISEAVGADIEDLGEEGRHCVLAIRGKGQTTKASLVPLNPALIDAVKRVLGDRTRGPLLVTSTGRRLTRQHAAKLIRQLGDDIGLPRLHPHALRHAFVTISLDYSSLRDVQDAARHADPRTTRRYDRNRNSLDRHPTHQLVRALEPEAL